jgi:CheY-like chemotaxis protein/RNA polymerase subunit RPABC4/transcription elongation factor Spt4
MAGETTFEEVLRVTHTESTGGVACRSCARHLADDMVVCPWCNTTVGRGHCESCARPLDPDWMVCPWCRHSPRHEGAAADEAPVERRRSATKEPREAREPSETRDDEPAADRPRVLVVDDDPLVRSFIATTLQDLGDVEGAATASEALSLITSADYDAVLIDQGLPDLVGLELIRLLRSEVSTAVLPLVLFTGQDANNMEGSARDAGADDFLTKPLEPAFLEERVSAVVARSPRLAAAKARSAQARP